MKSPLQNKKVRVEPVIREGGWLPKGHDGAFMYTGAKARYCVPMKGKKLVDPLTEEERLYFESPESGLALKPGDLSIYKKEGNFWHTFEVVLDKNGKELDLNDPMDYFAHKVLLCNTRDIAPSYKDRLQKGSYKFCLVEESEEAGIKLSKADTNKKVWMYYGKMEDSINKMSNFLHIYTKNRPSKNAKKDFLQGQISDIIEKDPKGFLAVMEDKSYETKAFIYECMTEGLIKQSGKTNYSIISLEVSFNSLPELVAYLEDVSNQENYLTLKGQLENSK